VNDDDDDTPSRDDGQSGTTSLANDPAPPHAIDPGTLDQSTRVPSCRLCTFRWIPGRLPERSLVGDERDNGAPQAATAAGRDRFTCCFGVNTDTSKHNLIMPTARHSSEKSSLSMLLFRRERRPTLECVSKLRKIAGSIALVLRHRPFPIPVMQDASDI